MNETAQLAARVAAAHFDNIPAAAVEVSKQAILDFIGVTVAGMSEPLSVMLRDEAREQGGHAQATVFATGERVNVVQAALINGAAGHAHDYDDVQSAMTGHPTVPVAPAVLALAEHRGHSGAEVISAYATGVDSECIVARFVGPSHYQQGWHSTGTLGTFGAAAAASHLLGLDAAQTATALGIAGTQAAGLKAQFGTMCKPLHAGHAAATGVRAANLAARGFSSRPDILETAQGFAETQSAAADPQQFARALAQPAYAQDILFKYHAACYLTHSAIEATAQLCAQNLFHPQQIERVNVQVDRGHFRVCNIQTPNTGLEAKFSLRFTVAMTLAGVDTSGIDIFTDALTRDPTLVALRDKIQVTAHDAASGEPVANGDTRVSITTTDGQTFTQDCNVGIPVRDLPQQWEKLERKFNALVAPRLGAQTSAEIIVLCRSLETLDDLAPLFRLLSPTC